MKEHEFKQGQKVKLKGTEEPIMIYDKDTEEGQLNCVWYLDGEQQQKAYEPWLLETAEPPTPMFSAIVV